jgi:hypothetical protein
LFEDIENHKMSFLLPRKISVKEGKLIEDYIAKTFKLKV